MFEPGVAHRLSARVQRIVAPNPGRMTGPGTNSYLIGDRELALIDPGPAMPAHIDALLAAVGDRLRWIFVTHTHSDHSPAWRAVHEATGAPLLGAPPPDTLYQDMTVRFDVVLEDGWQLQAPGFTLRAVHTPGHVGNHYCFLLEDEGMLFAGDHIMNGSTVVIIPPGGDMAAYIASLAHLQTLPIAHIAPGHGGLIDTPLDELKRLVAHRLGRERKVVEALHRLPEATLDALVPVVYKDVPEALHRMARLSLEAHLLKLASEQRAAQDAQGRWALQSV
jgi:glyoxylase-like metal-dependent hydrolase (beta-lactamase superfamily II)